MAVAAARRACNDSHNGALAVPRVARHHHHRCEHDDSDAARDWIRTIAQFLAAVAAVLTLLK
jgi:hypothetical protein